MKEHLTFSFIGGDLRQLRVISLLSDEGFRIRAFGLGEEIKKMSDKIYIAKSTSDCLSGADIIVLPLPFTSDKKTINAPLTTLEIPLENIAKDIKEGTVVFAGKADANLERLCKDAGVLLYDYAKREEMEVMNAVPTAEGAIETAMANTPFTIKGSRCLVIGYGRIGKVLSNALRALGADVTATSRRKSILAEIASMDCTPLPTYDIKGSLGEFDIIFNTVPDMVLGSAALAATHKDVLIIDLASRPGGVDFEEAKRLGRKVIWALSLPGKVAPYTAGKIIKDTIMNMIEELEV